MQQQESADQVGTHRWHRMGKFAVVASIAAASMTLAACGGSDDDSSKSSDAVPASSTPAAAAQDTGLAQATKNLEAFVAAPAKIGVGTPLGAKPEPGKTVAVLGTADPNNVKIQKKIKEITESVGWKYELLSYDPAKPDTFQSALTTALAKKADYITETGLPLTPAQLKQVKDAGAKLALSSVAPVEVKDPVIVNSNGPASDEQMGKMVADFFAVDSKGKGKAVMEHVPSYPILGAFVEGFDKEIAVVCPDCEVERVDVTLPQLAGGKVPSLVTSALRKNPDATYAIFDVGPFATGVPAALKAAGLDGKVKIIGEAADEGAIAGLKDGSHTAWTGFDSEYSAYALMDAMFRDAEGSAVPVDDLEVNPTQMLTADNVGSTERWSEPQDADAQFKALWLMG